MTTDTIKLIPNGEPDEREGRQYYKPIVTTVRGESNYNAAYLKDGKSPKYGLTNVAGFWAWRRYREQPIKVGERYQFVLSTRPKLGQGAKPGAQYMDIISINPVVSDADGTEYADVGDDTEYADVGDDTAAQPVVDKDEAPAPPTKRSPLAGVQIPAEWSMASEYWIWNRQTERASIEKQVLWKINAERQLAGARMRTDLAIAVMSARAGVFDKQYVTTLFADAQKAINDLLFEQAVTSTEHVKYAVEQAEKPGEDEGEKAPW